MPHDKKKHGQKPSKSKQAGLGSANNFFETAEELANRHPESKERQRTPKAQQSKQENPEQPNP